MAVRLHRVVVVFRVESLAPIRIHNNMNLSRHIVVGNLATSTRLSPARHARYSTFSQRIRCPFLRDTFVTVGE